MIDIQELMEKYEFADGRCWKYNIETLLGSLSLLLSEVLEGSGYYAYRNPTKGEKCINISKLGVSGSSKKERIMWVWPKKMTKDVDFVINRNLFKKIANVITLPEPNEVEPGKCITEWKVRIDLPTALKILAVFAGKEYSE